MSLPEPSFIDRDPAVITAEMKASWETTTGKTLYPGQIESLLIDLIAYRETLVRIAIQEAAKQNLVAFARAPMLDYLGELVGTYRLDNESDDRLRERIKLAPEAFTTAGSVGSYRFHALSADASIVDVAVMSPAPGTVNLYPLTTTGVPDQAILDAVVAVCGSETVRPLTDNVHVMAPTATEYALSVTVTPYIWPDTAVIEAQIMEALTTYAGGRKAGLGRDVVVSAVIGAAQIEGIYKVEVNTPLADIIVPGTAVAICTGISVTVSGAVNG